MRKRGKVESRKKRMTNRKGEEEEVDLKEQEEEVDLVTKEDFLFNL